MPRRGTVAGLFLALLAPGTLAQSLETAVMPGQVIQGHAKWESGCNNCHIRFNRAGQRAQCLDCHKEVATDVSQHRRYHGRMGDKDCRTCHTEHKGRNANVAPINANTFDHKQTDFVLKAAHASSTIECGACHVPTVKYRNAPHDCNACHKKDDKHKGKLGPECSNCHTEASWKQTRFDHSKTKFPLRNAHADVKCESCHRTPDFKGTALACVSCHQKDDDRKGHRSRFGAKCETCHTDVAWKTTKFSHARDTKFELKGKHQLARCDSCHTGMLYQVKTPTACIACHRKDDDKKGHQGRFGEKCESCHVERSWSVSTFDHGLSTRYALRGKHAQIACYTCHKGFVYKEKLATACLSCHRKDDRHNGQLGPQCESCHNEASWKQSRIDHGLTRFPLLGKHAKVACKDCHTTPQFKDAKTDCYSCHRKDDKHKLRLGAACEQCHNPRGWKQWEFDHDRRTAFVLDGKHRGLDCLACHRFPVQGKLKLASTCADCHAEQDVHNGGFGRVCERCHVTNTFKTVKSGGASRLFQ